MAVDRSRPGRQQRTRSSGRRSSRRRSARRSRLRWAVLIVAGLLGGIGLALVLGGGGAPAPQAAGPTLAAPAVQVADARERVAAAGQRVPSVEPLPAPGPSGSGPSWPGPSWPGPSWEAEPVPATAPRPVPARGPGAHSDPPSGVPPVAAPAVPPGPAMPAELPAWKRYAVPVSVPPGTPMIAS